MRVGLASPPADGLAVQGMLVPSCYHSTWLLCVGLGSTGRLWPPMLVVDWRAVGWVLMGLLRCRAPRAVGWLVGSSSMPRSLGSLVCALACCLIGAPSVGSWWVVAYCVLFDAAFTWITCLCSVRRLLLVGDLVCVECGWYFLVSAKPEGG